MSKYALKRVDVVKGRIRIFKLLINQECEFDTFCGILLNGKKKDVIVSVYATLEAYANLTMLPQSRFKELSRPKSDPIKDYEVKSGNYRVYLFKDTDGSVVVFGGLRKNQKKDIKRFRSIKQDYFNNKKI